MPMKDIILSWALCSVVLLTALFLGWSFAEWDINPGNWTEAQRGGLAAMYIVLELIITILALGAANKSNAE